MNESQSRSPEFRISYFPYVWLVVYVLGGSGFAYAAYRVYNLKEESGPVWVLSVFAAVFIAGSILLPRIVIRIDRLRGELVYSRLPWYLPAFGMRYVSLADISAIVCERRYYSGPRARGAKRFLIFARLRDDRRFMLFPANMIPLRYLRITRAIAEAAGTRAIFSEVDQYLDHISETVLFDPDPQPERVQPVQVPADFGLAPDDLRD
jgi:hypothetical protein